jgi:hypothetical protein
MSIDPNDPRMGFHPDSVHLLRTTMQAQYQLSQMADQKANMVLAASFVIFSVSISQTSRGAPPLPLMILGAAAFASACFAVWAVLPSVKVPPAPSGPANILFFGSFTQVPEDEFVDRLMSIAQNPRVTFEAFARDIYQNGKVLARKKYRFLSLSYRILLTGLIASLAAFITPYIQAAIRG